jgi:hypothetical protein
VLCATGHVATLKPSPGRWCALCLGARGRAKALWHREHVCRCGADLLSRVHSGTRSTGYQQWPQAHLGRGDEHVGGANTFSLHSFDDICT